MPVKQGILVFLLICFPAVVVAQQPLIVFTDRGIRIENDLFRKEFTFSKAGSSPAAIVPVSWVDKRTQLDGLAPGSGDAWFEIGLNGLVVRSTDAVWRLESRDLKSLKHGGQEAVLVFTGSDGPANGLRLAWRMQAYPASPVVRERIELSAPAAAGIKLTFGADGKPLAAFPGYRFTGRDRPVREVRLATWGTGLPGTRAEADSPDEYAGVKDLTDGKNLAQNYMFHPRRLDTAEPVEGLAEHVGPVLIGRPDARHAGWLVAFEHGSPDSDPAQRWVTLRRSTQDGAAMVSVWPGRGAYFDGQPLTDTNSFATPWVASAVFPGASFDDGEAVLWEYLLRWINDEPASRQPLFYYNTWGMQRDEQNAGKNQHAVLTIERALQEAAAADELGVDMFVLDDGWQSNFGDWQAHALKFPRGILPLKQELDRRGMVLGIWLAPIHADSFATLARRHPEWLIRGANGKPVVARWNRNVFCLVSDYYDAFIANSKRLIDAGARHFKWDGVDTDVLCSDPRHRHGGSAQTREERQTLYGYAFAPTIVRAIQDLKAYNPEVVIEFDATEPNRSIGLAILSEAKYFWMNNGASWYGDRSRFRIKSMRAVPNEYHGLIPPVLQNAANYPHNQRPYYAQRYAVNTSLLGGLGFWGDLSTIPTADRRRVAETTVLARRVSGSSMSVRPRVDGSVGSTPEVYVYVDSSRAEGQVIAFSGARDSLSYRVPLAGRNLLAVLRHRYGAVGNSVILPFVFRSPDDTREAFMLSNGGSGLGVVSSTSWLSDARIDQNGNLLFASGAPGRHVVRWPGGRGEPLVLGSLTVESRILPASPGADTMIEITTLHPGTQVTVTRSR